MRMIQAVRSSSGVNCDSAPLFLMASQQLRSWHMVQKHHIHSKISVKHKLPFTSAWRLSREGNC